MFTIVNALRLTVSLLFLPGLLDGTMSLEEDGEGNTRDTQKGRREKIGPTNLAVGAKASDSAEQASAKVDPKESNGVQQHAPSRSIESHALGRNSTTQRGGSFGPKRRRRRSLGLHGLPCHGVREIAASVCQEACRGRNSQISASVIIEELLDRFLTVSLPVYCWVEQLIQRVLWLFR